MDVKKVLESIEQETRTSRCQDAKADHGKPRPSLVPPEAILAIAEVRAYGTDKYGSSDNWRMVVYNIKFRSYRFICIIGYAF